ncbi:hypothetical protein [Micromonospora eburnea]|nr:hypothetical protein [Micromonospora eburnea]
MTELGMFAYPWDLTDPSPEAAVAELAALGVRRIEVATAYHSAETIRPRRTAGVHVVIEPNVAHLPLDTSAFGMLAPSPGQLARRQPDLYPRLAAAARQHGMALTGWTIALHQSKLAEEYPEQALENCFGDRSGHGLCPANPEVAQYVVELATAVAATGHFDELMIESLSYTLAGHGHPHELWAVRLDPARRLLLSLCFCPSCLAAGQERGIDATALRSWVADRLGRDWNAPLAGVRTPDDGSELATLLVSRPDLAAYLRMRCEVVNDLLHRVVERGHRHGVRVVSGSAVWARPAAHNWMEGLDLGSIAAIADGVALMPYHPDPADVARDLDIATALMPPGRLQMLQTIWNSHHRDVDTLWAKIEQGLAVGIARFALYNLAMAPAAVLGWVPEVAARLANHSDPGRLADRPDTDRRQP